MVTNFRVKHWTVFSMALANTPTAMVLSIRVIFIVERCGGNVKLFTLQAVKSKATRDRSTTESITESASSITVME
jgi:hypothetical protein